MRNVLVAVGVCLLSVISAAAQPWTGTSTSDPTTRTGNVGIGAAVTTPAAPLDISTGTTQAWINLSSSNAFPPKINLLQSAAAASDLGIGSVNFTNGVGSVVSQITARYPGTDQSQSYMRFTTSGLERLRIDSIGNVGIGTGTDTPLANSTQTGVEVKSNTTAALWMTGLSNQGAAIRGRNMNAGGTASAMDDIFLAMGGLGYDGSAFASANRASIHFAASQAWTPANQGTYITFNTTPNNSTVRAERMRIDDAGNVGIGTSTPGAGLGTNQEAPLHILSTQNKNTILLVQNLTNDANVLAAFRTQADVASQSFQSHASGRTISRFGVTLGGWNEFLSVSGNGLVMGTLAGPLILGTNNANRLQIATNGNIGIGASPSAVLLEVGGGAHFSGTVTGTNIQAQYQDVAEWVPATETMPAGTVVIVSQEGTNAVTPSKHAYDTSVAGVVSPNPGLLLGVASESKAKIATTGRVRVRVDATKSPIRKGDLLVTSDKPGMAMLSEPLDLGGVKIHRPGTLIGKALEPLAGGEGEILVLLSLQ